MTTSTFNIEKCGTCLGALVTNIDLTLKLSYQEKMSLRAALDQHQVIFFPNQNLTPNHQKNATKIFGPLLSSDTFFEHLNDDPHVEVVINDENNPPIGTAKWHADLTWAKEPPAGTSLYSREIPTGKGDTIWVSMTAAYDSLSERMKQYLEGLKALHSWDMGLGGRQAIFQQGGDHYTKRKNSNPPIAQPLVRTHPRTKQKLIYVNPGFTSHIIDIPRKESDGILSFLYDLAPRPEFQLRHKWDVGTLAVWDNTATQHAAVDDFFPAYRELTRVTFGGHGKPK